MKVLVCGGRYFSDYDKLSSELWRLHKSRPITAVIEGGANGADRIARGWAKEFGVECITVPADWNAHGRAAGPIRNERMLREQRPDLVLAMPGGRGTADMVRRAKSAGVRVIEYEIPELGATPREGSAHE